jgi:hypothetical protein
MGEPADGIAALKPLSWWKWLETDSFYRHVGLNALTRLYNQYLNDFRERA